MVRWPAATRPSQPPYVKVTRYGVLSARCSWPPVSPGWLSASTAGSPTTVMRCPAGHRPAAPTVLATLPSRTGETASADSSAGFLEPAAYLRTINAQGHKQLGGGIQIGRASCRERV